MPEHKLTAGTYAALMLLSGVTVCPWQVYIALADYFRLTYHSNVMEFTFPALSTSCLTVTAAVMTCVGHRFSFTLRIFWPNVVLVALSAGVPALDLLLSSGAISRQHAFLATMLVVCGNALFSACMQNALFGLGSVMGDGATTALMVGNGMVGVVSVVLRAASKLGLPPQLSMWCFCGLATATLVASLVGYQLAIVPALRQVERRQASPVKPAGSAAAASGSGKGTGNGNGLDEALLPAEPSASAASGVCCTPVWLESLCVFGVFVACLSCFPGLTTSLVSTSWRLGSWFPLVLVAAFNVGDLAGKSLPALPSLARLVRRPTLPWCVLGHSCYVFLFVLMLKPASLPPLLRGDAFPLLVSLSFGVSTGFLGCVCLNLAADHPSLAKQADKERAGIVSSFCLMMGLSVGSVSGLAIRSLAFGS